MLSAEQMALLTSDERSSYERAKGRERDNYERILRERIADRANGSSTNEAQRRVESESEIPQTQPVGLLGAALLISVPAWLLGGMLSIGAALSRRLDVNLINISSALVNIGGSLSIVLGAILVWKWLALRSKTRRDGRPNDDSRSMPSSAVARSLAVPTRSAHGADHTDTIGTMSPAASAWKTTQASLDPQDYSDFVEVFKETEEALWALKHKRQLERWLTLDKSDGDAIESFAAGAGVFPALAAKVRATVESSAADFPSVSRYLGRLRAAEATAMEEEAERTEQVRLHQTQVEQNQHRQLERDQDALVISIGFVAFAFLLVGLFVAL